MSALHSCSGAGAPVLASHYIPVVFAFLLTEKVHEHQYMRTVVLMALQRSKCCSLPLNLTESRSSNLRSLFVHLAQG